MTHQHLRWPFAGVPGAATAAGASTGKAQQHTLPAQCWVLKFQRKNLQLLPAFKKFSFSVFSKCLKSFHLLIAAIAFGWIAHQGST